MSSRRPAHPSPTCSERLDASHVSRSIGDGLVHLSDGLQSSPSAPIHVTLFLATVSPGSVSSVLSSNQSSHRSGCRFLFVDDSLTYEGFDSDFGPLNLAMLYRFCQRVHCLSTGIKSAKGLPPHHGPTPANTSTVTKEDSEGKTRSSVLYMGVTASDVMRRLMANNGPAFVAFRDAAIGPCTYQLQVVDCIRAVARAAKHRFLDFTSFDVDEYEHYEKVENGDLNWIIPGKFIAFCGPHARSKIENGYHQHSPEAYFDYFRRHNVSTIVRLNKKIYDAKRFTDNGFDHRDLFFFDGFVFVDGSTPSDAIVREFIDISEKASGGIAVHCKAGLGRTGSLIGCYIMKHFRFTAAETIAWIRIARPGSVIGYQQHWLVEQQQSMWSEGDAYRKSRSGITADARGDSRSVRLFPAVSSRTSSAVTCNNNNNDQYMSDLNTGDRRLKRAEGKEQPKNQKVVDRLTSEVETSLNLLRCNESLSPSAAGRSERVYLDTCRYSAGETQGDYLNRVKATRSTPSQKSSTACPVHDVGHEISSRSSSAQPLTQQHYNTRASGRRSADGASPTPPLRRPGAESLPRVTSKSRSGSGDHRIIVLSPVRTRSSAKSRRRVHSKSLLRVRTSAGLLTCPVPDAVAAPLPTQPVLVPAPPYSLRRSGLRNRSSLSLRLCSSPAPSATSCGRSPSVPSSPAPRLVSHHAASVKKSPVTSSLASASTIR